MSEVQSSEAGLTGRKSDFLGPVVSDQVAEAIKRTRFEDGRDGRVVAAYGQLREATNGWVGERDGNEHQRHAAQMIGGYLAGEMAKITSAAIDSGHAVPASKEDAALLSAPREHEAKAGIVVMEGVPMPTPLIGTAEVKKLGELAWESPDFADPTGASAALKDVRKRSELALDLHHLTESMPERADRTPEQQNFVAAVNYLGTNMAVEAMQKSSEMLAGSRMKGAAERLDRVNGNLEVLQERSERLWVNNGLPAFEGQHPKAVAALKPGPYRSAAAEPQAKQADVAARAAMMSQSTGMA